MKRTSALLLTTLIASAAFANQEIQIESKDNVSVSATAEAKKQTIRINNRSFLMDSQPVVRSFSVAAASAAAEPTLNKGAKLTSTVTGQAVTVTGRFTVLLEEGIDAAQFAASHGLELYKQMGNSRLAILEANDSVNLLTKDAQLRGAKGLTSVKLELLENLNQPM